MATNAFFAAGEKRDGLDLLSGRLDADLNAAFERRGLVLQYERGFSSAKHFFERFAEIFINTGKFPDKNFGHFRRDGGDDVFKLGLRVLHVVALGGQIFIALGHAGVFVDRAEIRRAEGRNFPAHLGNALVGCREIFNLDSFLFCRAGGQLIGIPELIDNLLFPQARSWPFFCSRRAVSRSSCKMDWFFSCACFFGLAAAGLELGTLVNGLLQCLPG